MSSEKNDRGMQLYEEAIAIMKDFDGSDGKKARLIIEYANDAIKAFDLSLSGQKEKDELRQIIEQVKDAVPPGSVDEIKERASKRAVALIHVKSPRLRGVVLTIIGLAILAPGFLTFKNWVSSEKSSQKIIQQDNSLITLPENEMAKLRLKLVGETLGYFYDDPEQVKPGTFILSPKSYMLKEITVKVKNLEQDSRNFISESTLILYFDPWPADANKDPTSYSQRYRAVSYDIPSHPIINSVISEVITVKGVKL